jgi:hypothetical protein
MQEQQGRAAAARDGVDLHAVDYGGCVFEVVEHGLSPELL